MEIDETPGAPTPLDEDFEKKARKKGNREADDQALNINSLMDIMTILLVFLLVSITSDPLSVKQDDFLALAKSSANYNPEDSVPITVTKKSIIVDNKSIVKVDCNHKGQICQDEDYTLRRFSGLGP